MKTNHPFIGDGAHLFLAGGTEPFGAVREVGKRWLVGYVENLGEVEIPYSAIQAVVEEKVILDPAQLSPRLREAIGHAHDDEQPGV